MKALVFDLDGTLVDTKYDMLEAGNLVFESQGWATRLEGFSGLQTAIQGGRASHRHSSSQCLGRRQQPVCQLPGGHGYVGAGGNADPGGPRATVVV